ncbi:MAG: acetyl-CoA carboxylase biotin carboxyl carrier protein subunit, partial [Rhodothermaceae bacterium]|nr:acetyl-CoA carboxylase biotin carboxyl carrier protein subunit [Rhodothermaceae bacterium]
TQVLVNHGDRVVPGQGLVVLEAMKMENELRSPIEGRIGQVYVQEGESVTVNAILVEFEL